MSINSDQLQRLHFKLDQFLSSSNFAEIIQAPVNLSSNQTFNYKGNLIRILNSCTKNSTLFVFQDSATNQFFALADAGSNKNGSIISERKFLNRHTQPQRRPFIRTQIDGDYAIFYSVEKESTIEFWLATRGYEVKVHTSNKQLVQTDTEVFPPGYYLAVWSSGLYTTEENLLSQSFKPRNPFNDFGSVRLGPSENLSDIFVFDGGRAGSNIGRVPTPAGFPAPYFTNSYLVPGINVYYSAFSDSEITYTLGGSPVAFTDGPNYPSDTVFRTTVVYKSTLGGEISDPGIYEYTGLSNLTQTDFDNLVVPDFITAQGFSKDDLVRPNNNQGRVYAKVYDLVSDFHITFALIPWNENPGGAWPKANRVSFQSGANGISEQGFFPENTPSLVFDGRDLFTPSPTAPQEFYLANGFNTYASGAESGSTVYFFIKELSEEYFLKNVTEDTTTFQEKTYKEIKANGAITNISNYFDVDTLDGSNLPESKNNSNILKALQNNFTEWRWPGTGLSSNFTELTNFSTGFNAFGTFRIFPQPFISRNKLVNEKFILKGFTFSNNSMAQISVSNILDFLENGSGTTFEAGYFLTPYVSRQADGFTELEGFNYINNTWERFTYDLETPLETTIEVVKPKKLKNIINNDGVNVLDIFPLISTKIQNTLDI
jgi:hypothetical protein